MVAAPPTALYHRRPRSHRRSHGSTCDRAAGQGNRNGQKSMLQAIRTRVGGIVVKVLFGLLILSFGFWGIYTRSPFFQDTASPEAVVASVGDKDIRVEQLQAALQPAIERLRAQLGGTLNAAQVKQLGISQ